MRAVVEAAEPGIADRISSIVADRLLPAAATGDVRSFGAAVAEIGRLNGEWYAAEQGGVYRPSIASLVATLRDHGAVFGAGQSSWGPTVYAVTDADHVDDAEAAARAALDGADLDGVTRVARPRNAGAAIERDAADGRADTTP